MRVGYGEKSRKSPRPDSHRGMGNAPAGNADADSKEKSKTAPLKAPQGCGTRGRMGLIAKLTTAGYNWPVITLQLIATMASGLFSGASIYVNLVEHPARIECGTASAIAQWVPSYKRATEMQATLAAVGFLSATGAWLLGCGVVWLLGGVLLGLVIPFTLIVILPTNRRLLSPSLDKESSEARQLLDRWGRLHAVRSFLSLSSFLVFIVSLGRGFH